MTIHPKTEFFRDLARNHQVVAAIGARGTGKSLIASNLVDIWERSKITVRLVDAGQISEASDLDAAFANALGCDPHDLTAGLLGEEKVVRVVIDRAEQLHSKPWFIELQERWRALLSSQTAKGRVAVVFFGRPQFRQIAGGDGSPLLNIGRVAAIESLSPEEIRRHFEVTENRAQVIHGKTGGHYRLTELFDASLNEISTLKKDVDEFLISNRDYIAHLIEDHPMNSRRILGHLLDKGSTRSAILVHEYCGESHASGVEQVSDLESSGLIQTSSDGVCKAGPLPWTKLSGIREILRVGSFRISTECSPHFSTASREMFELENALRQLVVSTLSAVDPQWWPGRIAPETAGNAESKLQQELDLFGGAGNDLHPIMFLSFGELIEVIKTSCNWDSTIGPKLGIGKSEFGRQIDMVFGIRNQIAHNRPVSQEAGPELRSIRNRLGLGKAAKAPGAFSASPD